MVTRTPFQVDMALLEPVHEMMQTGIRVDEEKKTEFHQLYHERWQKAQEQIDRVAGGPLNVGSPKQMKDFLFNELKLPPRTKGGKLTSDEDALRSLMAVCNDKANTLKTNAARYRWMQGAIVCRLALNIRSARKRLSSYIDIDHDTDGRIRSTISVGGTETGRFSHSKTLWGTGVNLATIPRELRSMYIADPGYVLAEFDLNRGESWVYAHLSEDPELLRIHEGGFDFHAETASAISSAFGAPLTVEYITAHRGGDAYKIRYLGKKVNHASAYRMGPYRGAQVVNAEADDTGITITVGQFREAQARWREKYFMMPSWWAEIERDLGTDRTLKTPYGRQLQFHGHWGEGLFKEATAYVPQSTSVDYLNRGLIRVYENFQKKDAWGLKILSQTHDSILVTLKEDTISEAAPAIIEMLTDQLTIKGRTFSIPVEGEYGPSWGEMDAIT